MLGKFQAPQFRGDYFSIGYQHAIWWSQYFTRMKCKDYSHYFRRRLSHCWNPRYLPLFNNTLQAFPEIILEIAGMTQALNDAGYRTTLQNVFANCLGETGDKGSQCTAFCSPADQGVLLAHNEEEAEIEPLCIATVELTGKGRPQRFMAASYPFQLFGSAFGGANPYLAFQGNSIGYSSHIQTIERTWHQRLPKTVITRKWLECTSIREALNVTADRLFSLPSHHYILTPRRAYSVEVRPASKFAGHPPDQFSTIIVNNIHCHTNHFIKDGAADSEWEWKYKTDREESAQRLAFITSRVSGTSKWGRKQAEESISAVARHRDYRRKTSASFVVEGVDAGFVVSVFGWFNKTRHVVPMLR